MQCALQVSCEFQVSKAAISACVRTNALIVDDVKGQLAFIILPVENSLHLRTPCPKLVNNDVIKYSTSKLSG